MGWWKEGGEVDGCEGQRAVGDGVVLKGMTAGSGAERARDGERGRDREKEKEKKKDKRREKEEECRKTERERERESEGSGCGRENKRKEREKLREVQICRWTCSPSVQLVTVGKRTSFQKRAFDTMALQQQTHRQAGRSMRDTGATEYGWDLTQFAKAHFL